MWRAVKTEVHYPKVRQKPSLEDKAFTRGSVNNKTVRNYGREDYLWQNKQQTVLPLRSLTFTIIKMKTKPIYLQSHCND